MQKVFGMHEKLILHNPHALFFKETVSSYFAGKKSINKYDFFFDYIYYNNKIVKVLIDDSLNNRFSHGPFNFLKNPIIDFYAWIFLNRLNPLKFKIYRTANKFTSEDIIYTFLYGIFVFDNYTLNGARIKLFNELNKTKAIKLVHLSHYGYTSQSEIKNIVFSKFDIAVSENNLLTNSAFFNSLFKIKQLIVLPFVPDKKFSNKFPFEDRINRVLYTGSNAFKMKNSTFIKYFGHDKLQPLRNQLIENKDLLSEHMDFMINNLYSNEINFHAKKSKTIINDFTNQFRFLFGDFYRILHILFIYVSNYRISSRKNENEYYKIDIVEKYNQYKMFIVPEEVIDLPAIGFVEGMACGSAYIGLKNSMYSDIGMLDGVHYIGYDGTLNDLLEKINYYKIHADELKIIAENGYNFVKNNLNPDLVMKGFFNSLKLSLCKRNIYND
jgi:hypothetical protein